MSETETKSGGSDTRGYVRRETMIAIAVVCLFVGYLAGSLLKNVDIGGGAKDSVFQPSAQMEPTASSTASVIENLRRRGMLTISISGWAVDSSFKHRMGVDETFPMSDHADFNDLLWFTERCDPAVVYTHHGFERDLASHIQTRLGIETYPLVKDQRSLLEF